MSDNIEKWMEVKGYPAYKISSFGRVQTRWRWGTYYNGFNRPDVWKDLPIKSDAHGYPYVHLCDGVNKPKTCKIHRLVAEHFLGKKPEDAQVVRHMDNNKNNNNVKNLAYGTYKDNENDKIRHGTWNTRYGGAKLAPQQVVDIRKKIIDGVSDLEISKEYVVSRPTITRIRNNKIWK